MPEMKIKFENVCFSYNHKLPQKIPVLSNINLEINEGEFVGIVGPTGSGKTTLMQLFTALLKPTTGTVQVNGKDLWGKDFQLRDLRKSIGLVFQFPESQLFEETVFADVAFAPRCQKLSEKEIEHRVQSALRLVGMDPEQVENRSPHNLSDGEMRRVALAGVLAMAPEMLILDEPTAGLDPLGVKLIIRILKRLHEEGITIVLISHNMDLIFQLTSRIIMLNKGSVLFDGDKRSIIKSGGMLQKAKLELPRIIQLSQYLQQQKIIQNWEVYSKHDLLKQLKNLP
jgi:energy-coupling factor transport system ATP-binding protein